MMNHIHIAGNMGIKCEPLEDPYSFVDDDPTPVPQPRPPAVVLQNMPKKRGRKKKIPEGLEDAENMMNSDLLMKKRLKNEKFPPVYKERKKHDRFNGMPEEEVSKRTLPDHLTLNLDIIIIGINPGLFAAYKGHHYAGPGNHFCKTAFYIILKLLCGGSLIPQDQFNKASNNKSDLCATSKKNRILLSGALALDSSSDSALGLTSSFGYFFGNISIYTPYFTNCGVSHNKGEEQNEAVEEIETSLDNWEDVGHGVGVPFEDCMPLD
uniref:G/T mismatch-specific thymine DNA glycosylase n=1 Tax=Timema tahoe TaxID=61484 RepID=A0A7R9IIK1_9NEOP|nr:unnamed protein product [Timema tahoe]